MAQESFTPGQPFSMYQIHRKCFTILLVIQLYQQTTLLVREMFFKAQLIESLKLKYAKITIEQIAAYTTMACSLNMVLNGLAFLLGFYALYSHKLRCYDIFFKLYTLTMLLS